MVREVPELADCLQRTRVQSVGVANRRTWSLVWPGAVPVDCRRLPESVDPEREAAPATHHVSGGLRPDRQRAAGAPPPASSAAAIPCSNYVTSRVGTVWVRPCRTRW